MDTISRKDAVKAIEAAARNESFREGFGYAEGIHDALAAINALPAVDEWQPIETLRRDHGEVLIFIPDGTPQIVAGKLAHSSYDGDFVEYSDGLTRRWEQETHWRPLPEPPQVK